MRDDMRTNKFFLFAAFILLALLIFPAGTTVLAFATDMPDIIREDPHLIIGRDYKTPVFQAGTNIRLGIPLENTTNGEAIRVHVTPVIDDPDDFPFEINGLVARQSVSSVLGLSSEHVGVNYQVRANAAEKMYPIRFNIEYSSASGRAFSLSETLYIKIENDLEAPTIKLHNVIIEGKELHAGQSAKVTLDLQNAGDLNAKDIKVTLTDFSNNKIRLSTPEDTKILAGMESKHFKLVPFELIADDDLDKGTYTADLLIEYKDELNKSYSTKAKVYLPVVAGSTADNVELSFENLKSPQETIGPNEDFNLTFDLKNIGSEAAQNVKLTVVSGSDILPKSVPIRNVAVLKAGESTPFTFTLFAKEEVETKNYPIEIKVEYEKKGNSAVKDSFSKFVGVFVAGKSGDNTPKVILDAYNFSRDYVQAGENFPLSISLYNTSKSSSVSNIRLSLSSEGDVFSPVGSSNSFYVEEIPANGRIEKNLLLKPKIDAAFKTHNIMVDIEYEDKMGKSYTSKEMIGVPVIQEVSLNISEVTTSPEAFVGNHLPISVDFYNTGRALIRNLVISVEGNFDTIEGELYIGNMDLGKSNYYDTSVIPTQAGLLSGKVIFAYDDEINNHYTVAKEFNVEVMEAMPTFMPEGFPGELEKPQQSNRKYFIGGAILVIAVGGYIFYRRRKKKLEEVDFDE